MGFEDACARSLPVGCARFAWVNSACPAGSRLRRHLPRGRYPPDPRTGSCRPCGSPRHSEIGPCLQGSPCVPGAWCRLGPSARASWAKTGGRQGKPGRTRGGVGGGSRGRRAVPGTSALGHGGIAVGIGASRQVRGQAGRPSHLLAQAAPPLRAVMEPAGPVGSLPPGARISQSRWRD